MTAVLAAFALDQSTKLLALAALGRGDVQAVCPILNLRLGFNRGVSFGLFADAFASRPVLLAGITVSIIALLVLMLVRSTMRLEALALGLIIGGALGNVLDRVRLGAVVDFLDFNLLGYHWPTFNFADSTIAVGVGLLVWHALSDDAVDTRKKSSARPLS